MGRWQRRGDHVITLELVIAVALGNVVAMDRLAPALRSDLVLVNPFYRRIVEFADDYLNTKRKLPGQGDWSVWLDGWSGTAGGGFFAWPRRPRSSRFSSNFVAGWQSFS